MPFRLFFPLFMLALFIAAYFIWGRKWLMKYQFTAGILDKLQNDELGWFAWLHLRLKGLWTSLLLFATSMFTGGWGLIQALFGVDPSALAPFQDSAIWKVVLHDEQAIRAASIAMFIGAIMTLKGKLHDAMTTPKPGA